MGQNDITLYLLACAATLGTVVWVVRAWLLNRILKPSPKVFINYRREDSETESNRLLDTLSREFGPASVFLDTNSVDPGDPFPLQIDYRLRDCDVVLVVIGRCWEKVKKKKGVRIMTKGDWVREEIVRAIEYKRPIVPILIDGRDMPSEESLPEDLHPLLELSGVPLDQGQGFQHDSTRIQRNCSGYATAKAERKYLAVIDYVMLASLLFLSWTLFSNTKEFLHDKTQIKTDRENAIKDAKTHAHNLVESGKLNLEVALQSRINAAKNVLPGSLEEVEQALQNSVLQVEDVRGAIITTVLSDAAKLARNEYLFNEFGRDSEPSTIVLRMPPNCSTELTEIIESGTPVRVRATITNWSDGFSGDAIQIIPAQNPEPHSSTSRQESATSHASESE